MNDSGAPRLLICGIIRDNLCEKRVLLLSWIHLYANLSRARLEETLDTSRISHELLLRKVDKRQRIIVHM